MRQGEYVNKNIGRNQGILFTLTQEGKLGEA